MTATNPDLVAVERSRAARLLGVEENAAPAEVRCAYLRKLREHDFVPPRSLVDAFHILDNSREPALPDEECLLHEEEALRSEVASFAEEFFTLPTRERRERWEALRSRCQEVPAAMARLQALKVGLKVDKSDLQYDKSPRGELAAHLLQTFPLTSLPRTAARQAFLRKIEEITDRKTQKLWEQAAHYLRKEWPAIAALNVDLVSDVARLRKRLVRRARMHRSSLRTPLQANLVTALKVIAIGFIVGMICIGYIIIIRYTRR